MQKGKSVSWQGEAEVEVEIGFYLWDATQGVEFGLAI